MYSQPNNSMPLAILVAILLLVLGAQPAYAAMPIDVTSSDVIVEEAAVASECEDCVATYALTVNVVGSGSVVKQPNQSSYLYGTLVNLSATAAEGYVFSGWSGECAGTSICSVVMDSTKSVTATFDLIAGDPNDAPSVTSAPVQDATAGANYAYFVTATDPDEGDFMILSAPVKPSWLALRPTGNGSATLTGTPGADNIGAHLMRLRVEDASGAFAIQDFILIVAPAPATTSSIVGMVVDGEGRSIEGAVVTLLAANGDVANAAANSQFTDSNGAYLFADVQPGDYTITARMDEQVPAALSTVSVMPGQVVTISSMTLPTGQLSLHLPLVGK